MAMGKKRLVALVALAALVSPSEMVETPRLQAKKVLAKWPREWP